MCSGRITLGVGAPATYGSHKTLSNRFRGWSDKVVFALTFSRLARSDSTEPEEVLMMDATDVKAHPTASSLNKGHVPGLIRRLSDPPCRGPTSKRPVVCDKKRCPVRLHLSEG